MTWKVTFYSGRLEAEILALSAGYEPIKIHRTAKDAKESKQFDSVTNSTDWVNGLLSTYI